MDNPVGALRNPQLDGSPFFWPRGDIAILCIHGFTATTVEVRQIAAFFKERGYTTRGPLLPGHGTNAMDMNKTTWQDWLGATEHAMLELMGKYEKVFVLGESMGGLLALYLAAKYPSLLGAMVFAPAIKQNKLWLSRFLWPFKSIMKKGKPDPEIAQQSYNAFPVKAASSLLEFQHMVKKELVNIKIPVIIFQGKHDDLLDPMGAVYAYEHISSIEKEFVFLEESSHLILLDKQLPVVKDMCETFIIKHSP